MATLLLDLEVGIQLRIVVKPTVGVCQILAPQNVCMMNTYSIFSIYSIDHNYILQSERKSPWVFVSHTQVSPGFSNRWIKLYNGSTDKIFFFTGEGFLRICCQRLPKSSVVRRPDISDPISTGSAPTRPKMLPRGENNGGGRVWQDFGSMEDM